MKRADFRPDSRAGANERASETPRTRADPPLWARLASPSWLGYQKGVVRRLPEPGRPLPVTPPAAEPIERLALSNAELNHDEEEALVHGLIAKHPHAARAAWERFSPMVRRIVRRTLGPANDAEDLVQEVFMQLFAKVHTLREPKALRAFVTSFTTLTLRREFRRRKLRSWLGLRTEPVTADLRVVHPDPIGRAALERFYQVLDRLDARDRTAFVLRFIEGFAIAEVAAALGVSLATAKRSLVHSQRRVLLHVERDPLLADYLAAALQGGER
jgi:RNA polymerase sigma-70 factor (ECF subfamily)